MLKSLICAWSIFQIVWPPWTHDDGRAQSRNKYSFHSFDRKGNKCQPFRKDLACEQAHLGARAISWGTRESRASDTVGEETSGEALITLSRVPQDEPARRLEKTTCRDRFQFFSGRSNCLINLYLSSWLQNTAHVSHACIGFCDSYSDERHNNCSLSNLFHLKAFSAKWLVHFRFLKILIL